MFFVAVEAAGAQEGLAKLAPAGVSLWAAGRKSLLSFRALGI